MHKVYKVEQMSKKTHCGVRVLSPCTSRVGVLSAWRLYVLPCDWWVSSGLSGPKTCRFHLLAFPNCLSVVRESECVEWCVCVCVRVFFSEHGIYVLWRMWFQTAASWHAVRCATTKRTPVFPLCLFDKAVCVYSGGSPGYLIYPFLSLLGSLAG